MTELKKKYHDIAKKMFDENIGRYFDFVKNHLNPKSPTDEISVKKLQSFIDGIGINVYCEGVVVEFIDIGMDYTETLKNNIKLKREVINFITLVASGYGSKHANEITDGFKDVIDGLSKTVIGMFLFDGLFS